MKKRMTAIALVICLLAIGIVGATMSYFTDKETSTNTFTMGKGIFIDLSETSEETVDNNGVVTVHKGTPVEENGEVVGYTYDKVLPGLVYSKKPTVTVERESGNCWLVATVTVNNRALLYRIYPAGNPVNHGTWLSLAGDAALVKGGISDYTATPTTYQGMSGNKLSNGTEDIAFVGYSEDEAATTITYTYYFYNEQTAGESYTLFETVTIPSALTQEMLDANGDGTADIESFNVTVNAYAIQAEGFADAYAAYNTAFAG